MKPCEQIVSGRYPFTPGSAVDVPPADFGRLFGTGGALFDAFFQVNLADQVDGTAAAPGYGALAQAGRRHLDGDAAPVRERTEHPRKLLGTGRPDAGAAIHLDARGSGPGVDPLHVGDGRSDPRLSPRTGAQSGGALAGPLAGRGNDHLRGSLRPQAGDALPGPAWAWFRLLDSASVRLDTDVRFIAAFQGNGHQATVIIEAPSIRNPYRQSGVRGFRCSAG